MEELKKEDKPPSNGLKNELLIYIYNVIEDEWPFITSISNPIERMREIESCRNTADCYFLANAHVPDFIYISPTKIPRSFINYTKQLMGYKSVEILSPKTKTHLICLDVMEDKQTFSYILKKASKYKKVTLVSYASSPQLYTLRDTFLRRGIPIYTPEIPEIDCAWTVNFFGSKSGIRQLAQQSGAQEPDFMMPEGVICVGKFDAAKIAANKYLKQKGVVIKTNKGSSGNGVLIFREGDLPNTYRECEQAISKILDQNSYWEKYPIIIEELININYSIGGGYPNVEFKIQKNGRIEMMYYCTCTVTPQGHFLGIDINDKLLNDRHAARIIDTGFFIAEQYAASGYRGYFDIDMMAAKNNHIYVCESNTRNTGGTDVFEIARHLLGEDFMNDSYVFSRSHENAFKTKRNSLKKVLETLAPILYSPKKKEGIIINSEKILKQKALLYMIIGKTKKRAYQLQSHMFSLLHITP